MSMMASAPFGGAYVYVPTAAHAATELSSSVRSPFSYLAQS
jgi:hypothetical protein